MLWRDGEGPVARTVNYTDDLTGFYVRAGKPEAAREGKPDTVEAYSWGGLTSSAGTLLERVKRVAWLVLLPFAMVNVAYWTRPGIDREGRPGDKAADRKVTAVAARWAGLLMTMTATAAVCVVSMDLLAWQCFRGGSRVCSLPGWAPQWVPDILGRPGWNEPSQRLVIAAAVPVAAILFLVFLSKQSRARYETVTSSRSNTTARQGTAILQRQYMWRGEQRIQPLITNHVAVALSVVTACLTAPVMAAGAAGSQWLRLAAVLAAAAVMLAFVSTLLSWSDGIEFPGRPARALDRRRSGTSRTALVLGLAALAVAGITDWLGIEEGRLNQARDFFDSSLLLGVLFLALAAHVVFLAFASVSSRWGLFSSLLLVLATAAGVARSGGARGEETDMAAWILAVGAVAFAGAAVFGVRHRLTGKQEDSHRQAWRGAAPGVLLGGAVAVAMLFTTSLVVGAADLLNGDQSVTETAAGYPSDTSPTALLLDADGRAATPAELSGTGPITVTDGEVNVRGDEVVVVEGTVSVAQASTVHEGATRLVQGLIVGGGEQDVEEVRLETQEAALTLDNSCLGSACDAEDGAVSQSSVPIGDGVVLLSKGVRLLVEDPPQETLVLPNVVLWSTTMTPVWSVAVVLMLLLTRSLFRRKVSSPTEGTDESPLEGVVRADIDRRPGALDLPNDEGRIVAARRSAAFVHRAERLVGRISIITVVAFLVMVVGAVYGRPPWEEYEWLHLLTDAGLYFALALALALLWFISQVRKSDSARRQAGVLWDIATFLPRTAHPFGPPSYGERVVPEITRRVRVLLDEPGAPQDTVVLSAHSQGAVIAAAVATRLSDDHLKRVRLVTYGSQLRAWFGRLFPAVLGPEQLGTRPLPRMWDFDSAEPDAPLARTAQDESRENGRSLGRDKTSAKDKTPGEDETLSKDETLKSRLGPGNWRNLYRRSDPIGFPIFADPAEPQAEVDDVYVFEIDAERYDLATHSGYQFTPEYDAIVQHWVVAQAAADAVGSEGE